MGKIYRGDTGIKIVLDTETDLTDATMAKILVKKPSGSEDEWIADFDDKIAGKISYTISHNELNETGLYKLQAYVEFTDGSKLLGETCSLVVFDKYE
jgi:tRNA(Met) C34 N-acetyltransferase TmcA